MPRHNQQFIDNDKKHGASKAPAEPGLDTAAPDIAPGPATPSLDHRMSPAVRRKTIIQMQQRQGNTAVRRFLAGRANTVQRDPAARYNPPPQMTAGRLPSSYDLQDLAPPTSLADNIIQYLYPEFKQAGSPTTAQIYAMCNVETLRNNMNALFGAGYMITLNPATNAAWEMHGDIRLKARVTSPTWLSSDGGAVTSTATSGVGTGSSGSYASGTTVGVTGGVKAGDAKAGGEGSAGVSASGTDTSTTGSSVSMGGAGARAGTSAQSVRYSFGLQFTAEINEKATVRTWAAIGSLGTGLLMERGDEHRTAYDNTSGNIVRIPAEFCGAPLP